MSDSPAAVRFEGVVKSFGNRRVINELSLTIGMGEHVAVLGPNGAGKTTLIRLITGILPADRGSLEVLGHDPYRKGRLVRSALGVVPQGNSLDTELDVLDNLLTFAGYFGMTRQQAMARSEQVLTAVRLDSRRHTPVAQLSGGMQRRLLIARALLTEPQLILLDEPTTGLDTQSRRLTWQLIREQKRAGRGMLLTTHYLQEVEELSDRVLILANGQVLRDGTVADVVADTVGGAVLQVEVRSSLTANWLVETIRRRRRLTELEVAQPDVTVHRHGARLRAYFKRRRQAERVAAQLFRQDPWTVEEPSLEDAYVKLTGTEGGT